MHEINRISIFQRHASRITAAAARRRPTLLLAPLLLALAALACNLPAGGVGGGSTGAGPLLRIDSPDSGAQFTVGDEIEIQSTAIDSNGIARIDLLLDGQLVRSDAPPDPASTTEWTVRQTFAASAVGSFKVSVVAANNSGGTSEAGPLTVEVVAAGAEETSAAPAAATPTLTATDAGAGEPSETPTATATTTATPTETATATASATSAVAPSDTPTSAGPLLVDRVLYVGATRDPADTSYGLVTLSVEFSGGAGPYTIFDQGQPLTTSEPHGSFQRDGRTIFWIEYGPIRWRCGNTLVGEGQIQSDDGQTAGFNFYFENIQCS